MRLRSLIVEAKSLMHGARSLNDEALSLIAEARSLTRRETGVRVDCPAFHRQVVRIQT
jgi:hypothetical protein